MGRQYTKDLEKIGIVGVDLIQLAQDRVQWRVLVKWVIKFWFHQGQKFLE